MLNQIMFYRKFFKKVAKVGKHALMGGLKGVMSGQGLSGIATGALGGAMSSLDTLHELAKLVSFLVP